MSVDTRRREHKPADPSGNSATPLAGPGEVSEPEAERLHQAGPGKARHREAEQRHRLPRHPGLPGAPLARRPALRARSLVPEGSAPLADSDLGRASGHDSGRGAAMKGEARHVFGVHAGLVGQHLPEELPCAGDKSA